METTLNNIIEATMNVDIFIVPNSPSKADTSWSMDQRLAEEMQEIADDNGYDYDVNIDKLVQLWWTNDEFDNLNDHGFQIKHDGYEYHFGAGTLTSYLPETILRDKVEGESFELKMHLSPDLRYDANENVDRWERRKNAEDYENEDGTYKESRPVFEITFVITPNQSDYRYRRFGTFEEVFNRLT